MDINQTLKTVKEQIETIKQQEQQLKQLRKTVYELSLTIQRQAEPEKLPAMPCIVCHGRGIATEWAEDRPGAVEVPCPNGCEYKPLKLGIPPSE
jgi:hypothetical protein